MAAITISIPSTLQLRCTAMTVRISSGDRPACAPMVLPAACAVRPVPLGLPRRKRRPVHGSLCPGSWHFSLLRRASYQSATEALSRHRGSEGGRRQEHKRRDGERFETDNHVPCWHLSSRPEVVHEIGRAHV